MNIQTLAANSKSFKLKKYEAATMIEKLYNDRSAITDDDLAQLYKYFMPALPKKAVHDFQWLAKAASTDETRPYLRYIYCDGTHAIATDGHRMHWLLCNLPVGFYDGNQNRIEWDHNFPDWKRLLVEYEHSEIIDIEKCPLEKTGTKGTIIYVIKGYHFNKEYIDAVLNGETRVEIKYNKDMGRGHIKFITGARSALVMNLVI